MADALIAVAQPINEKAIHKMNSFFNMAHTNSPEGPGGRLISTRLR